MTLEELRKASEEAGQELPEGNHGTLVPASTGLWGRFKRIIFDADPRGKGDSILHNIVEPGLKNMAANAAMTIIYGKDAGTWRGGGSKNGDIAYNQFYPNGSSKNQPVGTLQPRKKMYRFQEVTGLSKQKAENTIAIMRKEIEQHHFCPISVMYAECDIMPKPMDENYGWYNLDNCYPQLQPDGTWSIITPTPYQLDKR